MRSLFFKVFALILLSAVALIAAVAAVFHLIDERDFDNGYERAHHLAEHAVEAYERGGERALAREVERLARREGIRAYLIDADGRAIGPPLPRYAKRHITRFPQTIEGVESPRGLRAIRAVSLTTEARRTYRFVMIASHRNTRAWVFGYPPARVLLSLLVIALASFLISILITRPLGALKSATQAFSGGNLRARAPQRITRRNDAFGELAREFDQMSARIEKLVGEHRRLLRDVSHELRSPLSRMQVAATLLEDGVEDKDARTHIVRILIEIQRLEGMIAQLLSLTRLQTGAVELQFAPVALRALLQRIARDAAFEFEGSGKRIEVRGDETMARADAEQLRSAFENIIRNGLRHAKSMVTVTLQRERGADAAMARVTIADDGAGVAQSELRNIFAPFYRPDESRSEATGNAGIGLAIAEGVIAAHGGRIAADNADSGGLVVTVHLPAAGSG